MGLKPGRAMMDSDARERADELVERLLSQPGADPGQLLEDENPAHWDVVRREALRDALRGAREEGRLSEEAYRRARVHVERWYERGANTDDLPHSHGPDSPTVEMPARAEEPVLLRYPSMGEHFGLARDAGDGRIEPTLGDDPPARGADPDPTPASRSRDAPLLAGETRNDLTHQLPPPRSDAPLAGETRNDLTHQLPPRRGDADARFDPGSIDATTRLDPSWAGSVRPRPEPLRPDAGMRPLRREPGPHPQPLRPNAPSRAAARPRVPQPDSSVARSQAPVEPLARAEGEAAAAGTGTRTAFVPGATIRGRYVIEEQIGSGGTALVFRARDLRRAALEPDAYVALKVPREHLRDREDIAARLKREFHQAQSISHPNVVRVFDIDCEQGTWFLTMELLDGESLATVLSCLQPKRLPQREAMAIISACGEALAHAHERGVLHGDFKPGNVFVTRSEDVFVLDFGVVGPSPLPRDASPTAKPPQRAAAATPCYASPDILSGLPPDERDDVFSLACVAYEVLTGRHPFDRHSTLEARDRGMRVRREPGLSRRQFAALERALAWQRRRRWESVREFLAALGVRRPKRSIWWHATAAALVGALASFVLLKWHQELESRRADSRGETPAAATSSSSLERRPEATTPDRFAPPKETSEPQTLPPVADTVTPQSTPRPTGVPERTPSTEPSTAGSATTPPPETRTSPPPAAAATTPAVPSQESAARAPARRTSAASGRISLEQSNIVVNERAVSVVVRVRRLESARGHVRIQWRAIPGEASPTKDYSMDGIGTIDIPDGQDLRVLYIPILDDDVPEKNESFDVELFAVSGSRATLGPISRATVTILDDD